MKKIFSVLIIPILAVMILCGCSCGKDKSVEDVQKAYTNMITSFVEKGDKNLFFSSKTNPNAIVISYPIGVQETINNDSPSTDLQKRYRALYYQQKILDEIFNYYNTYQESFYRIAKSKDIDEDKINRLYKSVNDLKDTLDSFKIQYNSFVSINENGMSDIMQFNLTSYSFYLNKVIDASFNFINKFKSMYLQHCISDYTIYNKNNLDSYVDVAYLDMTYVIYLENIKSFDNAVGDNGVCDLVNIIGNENEYNLLDNLNSRKSISLSITESLGADTEMGQEATELVNTFVYARDIFNQRLSTYLATYNDLDMYIINQYKFDLSSNVDYDSYLISLSSSDRAIVKSVDTFILDVFDSYLEKLNLIVQ